jgi:hypothetical protein
MTSPAPNSRRAGGYGYSNGAAVSLEVLGVIDGREVSVETTDAGSGTPREICRPILLHDLAARVFNTGAERIELPLTVTFEADDRTIIIEGQRVEFEGYSAGAHGWAGVADLADGSQVTVRFDGPTGPVELARCTDWAMPDRRPTARVTPSALVAPFPSVPASVV